MIQASGSRSLEPLGVGGWLASTTLIDLMSYKSYQVCSPNIQPDAQYVAGIRYMFVEWINSICIGKSSKV